MLDLTSSALARLELSEGQNVSPIVALDLNSKFSLFASMKEISIEMQTENNCTLLNALRFFNRKENQTVQVHNAHFSAL